MTIAWNLWRHRCERRSKKISRTVVHTWFQLWYYLCCIWFHSDLLWFSLLRDCIRHWHGPIRLCLYKTMKLFTSSPWGTIYATRLGTSHFVHFIQDPLQLLQLPNLFPNEPHHLWRLHFKILQEGLCGMNSRLTHSDCKPGFSDLGGAPLVHVAGLQPLAWRTIRLTLFDVNATGWSGGICITAPVEWTTIQLAADDARNNSHSPGAFPFVSTTFVSFLLPICPNDLSHFALAFVHLLHVCPGSLMHSHLFFSHNPHLVACALGPDSSCTGRPPTTSSSSLSLLAMNQWEHWLHLL